MNPYAKAHLRRRLRHRFVERGDRGYDNARQVFNGAIDSLPAAICYCSNLEDIAEVVRVASESGAKVTAKAGGHGVGGHCVAEDALVIDLSLMKGVVLADGLARVEAGATWKVLDSATATIARAVPGGTVSSTGVAGLTLGGGIGWLLPSYGLACDSLLGVAVVDGRGAAAAVDDGTDPAWMACLRGAGHNLGIVSEFLFRLHPVSPTLTAGSLTFEPEAAGRVLEFFVYELAPRLDTSLMVSPSLTRSPTGHPACSIEIVCNGDVAVGDEFVSSLRRIARPLSDTLTPRRYLDVQQMLDNPFRRGRPAYWKSRFAVPGGVPEIGALLAAAATAPTQECSLFLEHLHGRFERPEFPSVFPFRHSRFDVLFNGGWTDARDAPLVRAWARQFANECFPGSNAHTYVNYADSDDRVTFAEPVANVRRRVDPDRVFVTA